MSEFEQVMNELYRCLKIQATVAAQIKTLKAQIKENHADRLPFTHIGDDEEVYSVSLPDTMKVDREKLCHIAARMRVSNKPLPAYMDDRVSFDKAKYEKASEEEQALIDEAVTIVEGTRLNASVK